MEIIAEIGQNHNGDMNIARELIHAAKENGADVAKFQIYDAKKLFPKKGNEWYDYNCKTEISRDQVNLLADECCLTGIEFIASAFDCERVGWLEELGVKRHKIASRSIHDSALIKTIAETGKPVLVSLGMWQGEDLPKLEIKAAAYYLYCVSKYPASLNELNLAEVDFDKKYAGFSDHTVGITAAVVAFARGAHILEKHFTLDKKMYGPDHSGSMTPAELKEIARFRTEISRCL